MAMTSHDRHGVSNHRQLHCLFNRLFRLTSKKIPKLRATGLCEEKPSVTDGLPSQSVSTWCRHLEETAFIHWYKIDVPLVVIMVALFIRFHAVSKIKSDDTPTPVEMLRQNSWLENLAKIQNLDFTIWNCRQSPLIWPQTPCCEHRRQHLHFAWLAFCRRNPQINDEFNHKGPIMRKALPFGGTFMPCGFWLWWWWTYRLFFPVDDIWSGCLVAVVVVNTITCLLVIVIRLVWPPYFIRVIDEQAAWQNSSHLSISSIKYHTFPKLLCMYIVIFITRHFQRLEQR